MALINIKIVIPSYKQQNHYRRWSICYYLQAFCKQIFHLADGLATSVALQLKCVVWRQLLRFARLDINNINNQQVHACFSSDLIAFQAFGKELKVIKMLTHWMTCGRNAVCVSRKEKKSTTINSIWTTDRGEAFTGAVWWRCISKSLLAHACSSPRCVSSTFRLILRAWRYNFSTCCFNMN